MTETTITITRQVNADPERAFAAWVKPAELAQWWWPQLPDTSYEQGWNDVLDRLPGHLAR